MGLNGESLRAHFANASGWKMRFAAVGLALTLAAAWSQASRMMEGQAGMEALFDRLPQADATRIACHPEADSDAAIRVVAPLAFVVDAETGMRGADFLQGALRGGVHFALCPGMSADTHYTVHVTKEGQALMTLRIRDEAAPEAQQAAVLQFLKEFTRSSINLAHNAALLADPALAAAMPGPVPQDRPVTMEAARLVAGARSVPVPAR